MSGRETHVVGRGVEREDHAVADGTPGPLLQVRGVAKEYHTEGTVTHALRGVDLDVSEGEYLAVMGPSGSGKSTLLHIMGGLDRASSGSVWIGGRDLSTLTDRRMTRMRRRELGFVFQFFNLVPVLTAWENVALPLVVDGLPRRRYKDHVDRLFETIGLTDRADHLPSQLSGGQQQRVAVARALVAAPDVLFADEPTGNLDSQASGEILAFLRRLVDEHGQTVVIITHDAAAASWCDRVVYLRDGMIVDQLMPEGSGGERAKSVFAWLQTLEASEG